MEEELGATINDDGQQSGSKKSDSSQMEDGGRITRKRESEASRVQLVVWTGGGTCAGVCVWVWVRESSSSSRSSSSSSSEGESSKE